MKIKSLRKLSIPVSVIGMSMILTACGTATSDSSDSSAVMSDSSQVVSEQRARISQLEQQLRNAQVSRNSSAVDVSQTGDELFPPNPQAGQCYARILIPAEYRNSTERVLVREASERFEVIPAAFGTASQRVLVKEASTRLEVIPATYETVTERILVKEASSRIELVPATYRTVTEQVLVSPARTEWKRGPATAFASAGNSVLDSRTTDTGEIMCLVEIPAVFETVTRQVVDRAAQSREIPVAAEYSTVTKEVLRTPASTREVVIPAEYSTVEVTTQTRPASENRIVIPAEYDSVALREKISEEELEWRRVVCDVNLTASNIQALQSSLKDEGHYAGPLDGIIGSRTLAGANSYARSEGLPTGSNYISYDVIEELGLKF